MKVRPTRAELGLALIFAISGILHFTRPRPYEQIVPHRLPRKRELVYASGAAELLCSVGLMHPRTRAAAGLASAGLLVALFPANVQMAADVCRSPRRGPGAKALALIRLPMQAPIVAVAWRAFRRDR